MWQDSQGECCGEVQRRGARLREEYERVGEGRAWAEGEGEEEQLVKGGVRGGRHCEVCPWAEPEVCKER